MVALFRRGVKLTVNTDDPTFFGTSLVEEYAHLSRLGIPVAGLVAMLRQAIRSAFLDAGARQELQEELDAYPATHPPPVAG